MIQESPNAYGKEECQYVKYELVNEAYSLNDQRQQQHQQVEISIAE